MKIISVTPINLAGSCARFDHSDKSENLIKKYHSICDETQRRVVSNRLN